MLPLTINIKEAYANGKDDEQKFIQNLSLFLCTFLKEHGQLVEKKVWDVSCRMLSIRAFTSKIIFLMVSVRAFISKILLFGNNVISVVMSVGQRKILSL